MMRFFKTIYVALVGLVSLNVAAPTSYKNEYLGVEPPKSAQGRAL